MKSSHFCGLQRFLFYLEHQLTLFSSFFKSKNMQTKKNFECFDTSRGLTPFENCDFWPFEKFQFCGPKRFLFLFRTSRNAIQLTELVLTSVTTGAIEQSV